MNIQQILASWFCKMKRDLPWRHTSDPYKIWLSEIILQQTRVNQGISYYYKFISSFPDIYSLSSAKTDDVLKIWQGLGYYSRARNMHETAKYITGHLNGEFPHSYNDLIRLKGIGPYTAAAISSIAFNKPVAAIDGNVRRILSRLFLVTDDLNSGRGRTRIIKLAESILDKADPGGHNQALMDFGATVCFPKKPRCPECPLSFLCCAFKENLVHEIPAKSLLKTLRKRYLYYFIILSKKGKILIHRRTKNDIWNGLYEFPLIETPAKLNQEKLSETFFNSFKIRAQDARIKKISPEITHLLTHQHLTVQFVHAEIIKKNVFPENCDSWVSIAQFNNFPVPKLIERYISTAGI